MDLVHRDEEPEVYIAERLFSSSLVAVVSTTNPRTLRVCHFKKGTEICRYSYNDKIRAVRMNRSRLVVCLEESLYIHNIRDMKVIHIITSTPPNPNGLIALSADTSNFCFLAYPGHSHTGQLQVRISKSPNLFSLKTYLIPSPLLRCSMLRPWRVVL